MCLLCNLGELILWFIDGSSLRCHSAHIYIKTTQSEPTLETAWRQHGSPVSLYSLVTRSKTFWQFDGPTGANSSCSHKSPANSCKKHLHFPGQRVKTPEAKHLFSGLKTCRQLNVSGTDCCWRTAEFRQQCSERKTDCVMAEILVKVLNVVFLKLLLSVLYINIESSVI